METEHTSCVHCNKQEEDEYCHVTMNSLNKLKQSTRKLLGLLDEIQSKPSTRESNKTNSYSIQNKEDNQSNDTDFDEKVDNCTVYDRLIGLCRCYNQPQYNDFIIHFTEDSKHKASLLGEIIKNIRIIKKFLSIGGDYTKNALLFLNEGLLESLPSEKHKIVEGCVYADICNVFDEHSIVRTCISWPCKNKDQDFDLQALAAGLIHKLSNMEKGRHYLNLNAKIGDEIKKVVHKKSLKLELDTLEALNTALNNLRPPVCEQTVRNITYFCEPYNRGMATKLLKTLENFRQSLNINEILTHLDILRTISNCEIGKRELKSQLRFLLELFRHLLMQYDNSEMNILLTNILDNIVPRFSSNDNAMFPPPEQLEEMNTFDKKMNAEKKYIKQKNMLPRKRQSLPKKKDNKNNSVIVVPIESEDYSE